MKTHLYIIRQSSCHLFVLIGLFLNVYGSGIDNNIFSDHLHKNNDINFKAPPDLLGKVAKDHGQDPFLASKDHLKKLNERLATHPKCQAEITRICEQKADTLNDLEALECILDKKRNELEDISEECNHQIWSYRSYISKNQGFRELAAATGCAEVFEATSCWEKIDEDGFNYPICLSENKDLIKKEICRSLVKRTDSVIFGDFELLGRFAEKCERDIEKLKCGRNEGGGSNTNHKTPISQGKTIECLSDKISALSDECAREILRVAELQTEDYHLDRALYFACRNDREKFCSSIPAGQGMVYNCLLKNKMESEMSADCRSQIFRRQKIGWEDYKATGMVYSCKSEIKKYKCRKDTIPGDKHARLSQILLCLENALHTGHDLNGDCLVQIKSHRAALMDDFRISPEIIKDCSPENAKYCSGRLNAKTIHCLMGHASSRKERLGAACRAQLEDFIKILDISNDWRVDPVLKETCGDAVERSYCSKLPPNRILDCLMNLLTSDPNIGTDVITEECETTLLQIQYFLSRDFQLDSNLFEDCRVEASKICGAKEEWDNALGERDMEPSRGPLILSCLYRNIQDKKGHISSKCSHRIKDVMRRRALSVQLMPELEEPCMEDLADLCSDEPMKLGEELECLQDHLDELKNAGCKLAVFNYTQMEAKDPTIDPQLWKFCRETIEEKCHSSEDSDSGKSEERDVIQCLIDQRLTIKGKKCRASIEHIQLLRMKDIEFTPKFKHHCHENVVRYCKKERPFTPLKLVNCLSEIVRNDTISEMPHRILKSCRKQLRYLVNSKLQFELGTDNIDPAHVSIYTLCKSEVANFCKAVVPGGGRIFECLRENIEGIPRSSECYNALFKIQIDLNNNISPDLRMEKDCEDEIKMFCAGISNVYSCLEDAMMNNKIGFNQEKCGHTIRSRMIEQNTDTRLNPNLRKDCKHDIEKFCSQVRPGDGRIIACLKRYFIIPKNGLSQNCRKQIESIMEGAAKQDIRLDSTLYQKCKYDIQNTKCKDAKDVTIADGDGDGGAIEECLKQLYHDQRITEEGCRDQVAQLVQSSMIDIHVDPILNKACAIDLLKHCDGIPPGEGRLIGCLLNELENENHGSSLGPICRDLLSKRSELFKMAGSPLKLDSFQDLYSQIQVSPHKNYFLSLGMTILGCIFIFGLCCGRTTKRTIELKNK